MINELACFRKLDWIGEAGMDGRTNEAGGDGADGCGDDGGCLNHCDMCVCLEDGYMR